MPKSARVRARLVPRDLVETFGQAHRAIQDLPPVNRQSHEALHNCKWFTYTSKTTLDTTAGTEFYLPFGGELQWVYVSVTGAPVTNPLKVDVLVNGVTIFDGTYAEVPATLKYGTKKVPNGRVVRGITDNQPTPLKVQINTINSATGPMVVYFGLIEG